jgi:hypothetical protein
MCLIDDDIRTTERNAVMLLNTCRNIDLGVNMRNYVHGSRSHRGMMANVLR